MLPSNPALPNRTLLEEQAEWLAPVRSRLFRQIGIGHRKAILDLGAGYGAVTADLLRRSSGHVIALDLNLNSLYEILNLTNQLAFPVNADGRSLPFPDNSFDLIFCQCSLMWISPLEKVAAEIERTLQPGGVLVALEPDYGGMIEYPLHLATRDLWLQALAQSGADPRIGRKLPAILARHNLTMRISLLDQLGTPSKLRFDFLAELPLTAEQRKRLETVAEQQAATSPIGEVAHLPFFLITAEKPSN